LPFVTQSNDELFIAKMSSKFKDEYFASLQTRCSQNEARISILRNKIFGKQMMSKGFESRNI